MQSSFQPLGTPFLWLLVGLSALGCHRTEAQTARKVRVAPVVSGTAVPGKGSPAAPEIGVQTEMHNVDFHIDSGIVLHIKRLQGEMLPTKPNVPPTLDDKHSFILRMRSSEIAIDVASLSTLLNRHVFGYPGSPLKDLRVSTDGDQLVQEGSIRKGVWLKLTMRATVSVTSDGQIRLHPTLVKVLGVKVRGLMKFFGAHLDQVVRLQPGHGARIEVDDLILDPTGMLPAPGIRGRLTAIRIENGRVTQTFGPAELGAIKPLRPSAAPGNYMYFRGGTLRFGKLTMSDTDLTIVDDNSASPFDFSIDRYNEQLVAGYSKNTTAHGLIVHMPDLGVLPLITKAPRH